MRLVFDKVLVEGLEVCEALEGGVHVAGVAEV